MTRVLMFDGPKGAKRFELLRASLLNAGDGKGDRTPATIRKEARLQDLLDEISVVGEANGNGQDPDPRVLKEGSHTMTLAQEDFDLLSQYADKTAWSPRAARAVVDLWDWLSAAERRD